jgi:hypothetical protein
VPEQEIDWQKVQWPEPPAEPSPNLFVPGSAAPEAVGASAPTPEPSIPSTTEPSISPAPTALPSAIAPPPVASATPAPEGATDWSTVKWPEPPPGYKSTPAPGVSPPAPLPMAAVAPPPAPEPAAPGGDFSNVQWPEAPPGYKPEASPEAKKPLMSVEPEELGWLSEIMYSTVRGAGGVLKAPRAIMNVFGIKAGEGLAETGQELQQISPASPSVSKEFSMSLMADPKWWASALPSLAVQILPITIAALGGGAVAAGAGATAAGVAAAEAGAGMLAGGLIGVSDAGERMLEYEKTHGDLPTVKKILIGLGAGTAGAVLPGKVLGRLVGEGGEKVLASQAVTKIFESDLGKAVAERAVRAVVGGNAMAGFSLIENAFEKFGYNPDRQLTQGVLESLILGTAFAGIESEIGLARRRAAASGREVELQALLAQRITDLQAAHNEAIERLKGGPFNRFGLDQLIGQETEAAQGTVKPPAPETPVGAPEAAGAIPGEIGRAHV